MNKRLLYFSSSWCNPCKMLAPTLDSISGQVNIQKIDVEQQPQLASQHSVRNVPTLILEVDGVTKGRLVGVHSADQILNFVNNG